MDWIIMDLVGAVDIYTAHQTPNPNLTEPRHTHTQARTVVPLLLAIRTGRRVSSPPSPAVPASASEGSTPNEASSSSISPSTASFVRAAAAAAAAMMLAAASGCFGSIDWEPAWCVQRIPARSIAAPSSVRLPAVRLVLIKLNWGERSIDDWADWTSHY